jgi:hypothetical protein
MYNDQEIYNLANKDGWYVEKIFTDKEEGYVNEFIEKEGKWFNNINRLIDVSLDSADTADFTFQGLGFFGDYDPSSAETWNCVNSSCIDPGDGSGFYSTLSACNNNCGIMGITGCTDPTALNYDAAAIVDDGSCIYCVYGCTDASMYNYDANATCDDGSCYAIVSGCTDPNAVNYNSGANTDDGSCIYIGCTDPAADNYDPSANVDDGSCTYVASSWKIFKNCTTQQEIQFGLYFIAPGGTNKSASEWASNHAWAHLISQLGYTPVVGDVLEINFSTTNLLNATQQALWEAKPPCWEYVGDAPSVGGVNSGNVPLLEVDSNNNYINYPTTIIHSSCSAC